MTRAEAHRKVAREAVPGGPVAETLLSQGGEPGRTRKNLALPGRVRGPVFNPSSGNKIPMSQFKIPLQKLRPRAAKYIYI